MLDVRQHEILLHLCHSTLISQANSFFPSSRRSCISQIDRWCIWPRPRKKARNPRQDGEKCHA